MVCGCNYRKSAAGLALAAGIGAALPVAAASVDGYPARPIRMVASSAGGSADAVARLLGQRVAASAGQPVVVDNRGGSGGVVAAEIVAKAAPDGHTLLIYGSTLWIAPLMRASSPYDTARDFAPVTMTGSSISVLVVTPALQVRSVPQLIERARSQPGALNYGAAGTGATGHLAAELFKSMARLDIVRINYKGNAPVITDLIGGQIHLTFGIGPAVEPHMRAGRLLALAVTSAQPSPLLPGVPTMAASGLPGYEAAAMSGVFAPVRTPAAVIGRLHAEIVRVLARADVKERFMTTGVETVGSTPEEFAGKIRSEMARLGKVIRERGIRDE